MWWKKKPIPKIKIVSFIIRNNRAYDILYKNKKLFINKREIWARSKERIPENVICHLNFLGTGPKNFRNMAKKKRIQPPPRKK